jgi:hypothetical protein
MKEQNKRMVSRRKFLGTAASAAAFTLVPKNVLGKQFGAVAPSDKIRMAHIGCGIEGFAELPPLLACPDLQLVAVCDPETDGRNYLSFGNGANGIPTGVANNIRRLLRNPKWREAINYVPGGRNVMKEVIETYYAQDRAADKFPAVNAYNDFRELLEKEDIDAVKIMTPDHLHATIAIAAMKKGKHVITHKPLANRLYESDLVIKTAKETGVATYFMPYNNYQSSEQIKKMVADGAIGKLKEVHEWSARPMWTQNTEMPTNFPPVPAGFDWQMWLGPVPDRQYSPDYTHTLFRGWYDFGGGSFADMGHYTMWTVCDAWDLDVPTWAEGFGSKACRTLNFATGAFKNDFSFPIAETMRLHYNAKGSRGPIDVYWYDGGMRPPAIPELEEDKKLMGNSGILYIGDKGKILDGRLLPESKMKTYMGKNYTAPVERGYPGARQTPVAPGQAPGAPGQAAAASARPFTIGNLPPKFEEWIAACRGGSKNTPANFVSAEALSTMINLAIVAVRAGTRIEFDRVTRQITNNAEANKLLVREYRKGWEL